jgi:hypothetical protein
MADLNEMLGRVYGHWLVIAQIPSAKSGRKLLCRCVCGVERVNLAANLRNGRNVSCGCKRAKHGHTSKFGIAKKSLTHQSWGNMLSRCRNASNPAFAHYKARGINVCERWLSFENFLADMGERPSAAHTLDRYPKNDGNYEPGNCRWATKIEQANNRYTNIIFVYRGQSYTLANLARETGVSKDVLRKRLCRSGGAWTVEGAVNTPKHTKGSPRPKPN